jgi:hypothetical protein
LLLAGKRLAGENEELMREQCLINAVTRRFGQGLREIDAGYFGPAGRR